ncbi:MAG: phosphatase PAP2 family protein [Chloroflexi bacterium]|nr:phosphatase PAP2 family protein [Chloroflexota bacterium]
MAQGDQEVFLWINQWVGTFPWLDTVVKLVASDYLVPVVFSLVLLGLWFGWQGQEMRERHQRGVMLAGISVGIANAAVAIINLHYFRLRPFDVHEVQLLFYAPTDSSFPANVVVITFAIATGVWIASRKIAIVMYVVAFLFGLSRVFAGVHYPLDMVAGGLLGMATAYAVHLVLKLIEPVPTLCLRLVRFLCIA